MNVTKCGLNMIKASVTVQAVS